MLQSLGTRLFGIGGGSTAAGRSGSIPCGACPESLQCKAPEVGSVTPHNWHVLLKLAAPATADRAATDEAWWEAKVDRWEAPDAGAPPPPPPAAAHSQPHPPTAPLCRWCSAAPLEVLNEALAQLPAASLAALPGVPSDAASAAAATAAGGEGPLLPEPERLGGITLLVCCHTARDRRCGELGGPLAAKLAELAAQHGLGPAEFRVFKTSHIGGHVYAGNVIVYYSAESGSTSEGSGDAAPAGPAALNGDWYGGVWAGNAEAFLDALLAAKVGGWVDRWVGACLWLGARGCMWLGGRMPMWSTPGGLVVLLLYCPARAALDVKPAEARPPPPATTVGGSAPAPTTAAAWEWFIT